MRTRNVYKLKFLCTKVVLSQFAFIGYKVDVFLDLRIILELKVCIYGFTSHDGNAFVC